MSDFDKFVVKFASLALTEFFLLLFPFTCYVLSYNKSRRANHKIKSSLLCSTCLSTKNEKWYRETVLRIILGLGWLFFLYLYQATQVPRKHTEFNPFVILGLKDGSSTKEIKQAYRKLSKAYHPDKSDGNEKLFIKITKAYETLTHKLKRRNWEEYGHPDGPQRLSSGFRLPAWIVSEDNIILLQNIHFILLVSLPPLVIFVVFLNLFIIGIALDYTGHHCDRCPFVMYNY